LYQHLPPDTEKPRWISFMARGLSKSERNYSATKRELLGVIFALRKFHYFLWGTRFTLFTDHAALTYLHSQTRLNPMLAGWYETLFDYDFNIVHRPGVRNILPDHLSRFFAPPELEGGDAQPPSEVSVLATAVHAEGSARSGYIDPDPDKRAALLEDHHALGHFGATAMVKSIRHAGYNWTNIHQEALAICQRCMDCLRYNTHLPAFHQLQSITAALPFEHVAVDLAGPFTTSRWNNHYLHVMIDVHSRFMLLKAISDKRMETVAAVWLDIFTTFGFPKIIQSDNGTEFVNQTTKAMVRASKIEHRLISPYHPRANGVAERAVQTATRAIKKLLKGIKHNWDVYVPFVQYCINQKIAERHGHRPFAVVFGRQANSFADYSNTTIPAEFEPSSSEHERVIADIQRRVKSMQEELFPGVASKSRARADKTAKTFNKKHRILEIPDDTFVMVRDKQRKSKLAPTNVGPYKVIGKTHGGSYVLEDSEGQLLPHNFPPSALIYLSTDPSFEQESYEVDAILDHHEHPEHGMRYLVRWKNYAPEHDTWEPESHFNDHGVIDEYWSRRGAANA
jgi:transposase InsO family protein